MTVSIIPVKSGVAGKKSPDDELDESDELDDKVGNGVYGSVCERNALGGNAPVCVRLRSRSSIPVMLGRVSATSVSARS